MSERLHTLVVDDEENVRFFLDKALGKDGHTVVTAASGEQALDHLRDTCFDLAVLDLKLGGKVDGLRVLEAIRWRWPETLVIILTGHGSLESALAAIQEGVDGYLLKPAEPEDVRRAVREAAARRQRQAGEGEKGGPHLQQGALSIDRERHVASLDGAPLDLTPSEFRLLAYLVQHSPRVISPSELVQVVQEYPGNDEREAREIIKWYVHRLRRKLEPDPAQPRYILNVRGVGYRIGGETA
ncbi:MAG: response regulator transcription factor [Thermoflexales bacterium]|nr:response regulator transcription factor [Thermoflexales bacterium]